MGEMEGWKSLGMAQDYNPEGWVEDTRRINIKRNFGHLRNFLKPEDSILDVGCYAGYLKDYLEDSVTPFREYLGIDLFQEHIDLAQRLHPNRKECFKQGDLFEMTDRADVVVCSRVLIHIPDFEKAVQKLISAANRLVLAILKITPEETCERFQNPNNGEWFYQRSFTEDQVRKAFGDCQIYHFLKFSNVYKWV